MTPLMVGAVALAGGVGAALRFVVDGVVGDLVGRRWPWGIAVVNVSGSFLLGLVTGLADVLGVLAASVLAAAAGLALGLLA